MVKNFMEMQIVVGVICYLLPYIYVCVCVCKIKSKFHIFKKWIYLMNVIINVYDVLPLIIDQKLLFLIFFETIILIICYVIIISLIFYN